MIVEIVLGAAAEAIVDEVSSLFDLDDQLRRFLKRDPTKKALQKALMGVYHSFVRRYDNLANSLFTEDFLKNEAISELSKLLVRHEHPDPVTLARLWVTLPLISPQLVSDRQPTALAIEACEYFLSSLENELKAEPVFQALFDSRNLESIDTQLQRLQNEIASLQVSFSRYELAAEQKTHYIGKYERFLQGNLYWPPKDVFQRVHINDYVGRVWLESQVESFISSNDSGVVIIEGEAGVGKTCFLAHLVEHRHYFHLFAELTRNLKPAILYLATQLISNYQIDEYEDLEQLTKLADNPTMLHPLIRLAAEKLRPGEKLIIVCDALDEAEGVPGGNVFGLPHVLPKNVYLIVSKRPVSVHLHFDDTEVKLLTIDPASTENQQDIEMYLEAVSRSPEVAGQLVARNYTAAQFIRALAEKSGGVWIYLYYLTKEIREGNRAPLQLTELPVGVAGYYGQFWLRLKELDIDKWSGLYAPLLATMAAAQEPLTLEIIIEWADVQANLNLVHDILANKWGAFIRQYGDGRYGPYHASLRDFLTGNQQRLPNNDEISRLMARCTRDAHERIALLLLRKLQQNLVKLDSEDYTRKYLPTHLSASGHYEELYQVVTLDDTWAKARGRSDGYTQYSADLQLVWNWAVESRDNVKQIRCALIASSIHQLLGSIDANFILRLVEAKVWSYAAALAQIAQLKNEKDRVEALSKLSEQLPISLRQEAIQIARELPTPSGHILAMSTIAKKLAEPQHSIVVKELLEYVRGLSESEQACAIKSVAAIVNESQLDELLEIVSEIKDETLRSDAVIGLAPFIPPSKFSTAIEIVRGTNDKSAKAMRLYRLALNAPEGVPDLVVEALELARSIDDLDIRAPIISDITASWVWKVKQSDEKHAVEAVNAWRRVTNNSNWRYYQMAQFIPRLPASEQRQTIAEIIGYVQQSEDKSYIGNPLSSLIEVIPAQVWPEIQGDIEALFSRMTPYTLRSACAKVPVYMLAAILNILREDNNLISHEVLIALAARSDLGEQLDEITVLAEKLELTAKALVYAELIKHSVGEKQQDLCRALHSIIQQFIHNLNSQRATNFGFLMHSLSDADREYAMHCLFSHFEIQESVITKADWLKNVAKWISPDLLPQAIAIARATEDYGIRFLLLSGLAETARNFQGAVSEELAQSLPSYKEILEEALSTAQMINDWHSCLQGLFDISQWLPTSEKESVQKYVLKVLDISERIDQACDLLHKFIPGVTPDLLSELEPAIRRVNNEHERARLLMELAAFCNSELRQKLITDASVIAIQLESPIEWIGSLGDVAVELPIGFWRQAISRVDKWPPLELTNSESTPVPYEYSSTDDGVLKLTWLKYVPAEVKQDVLVCWFAHQQYLIRYHDFPTRIQTLLKDGVDQSKVQIMRNLLDNINEDGLAERLQHLHERGLKLFYENEKREWLGHLSDDLKKEAEEVFALQDQVQQVHGLLLIAGKVNRVDESDRDDTSRTTYNRLPDIFSVDTLLAACPTNNEDGPTWLSAVSSALDYDTLALEQAQRIVDACEQLDEETGTAFFKDVIFNKLPVQTRLSVMIASLDRHFEREQNTPPSAYAPSSVEELHRRWLQAIKSPDIEGKLKLGLVACASINTDFEHFVFDVPDEVMEIVLQSPVDEKIWWFTQLLSHLSPAAQEANFSILVSLQRNQSDPYSLNDVLRRLALSITPALLRSVIEEGDKLENFSDRIGVLLIVAERLPEEEKIDLRRRVLTQLMSHPEDEESALERLPQVLIPEALHFIKHLPKGRRRAAYLRVLLPQLTCEHVEMALPIIRGLDSSENKKEAITILTTVTSPATMPQLLHMANELETDEQKLLVLKCFFDKAFIPELFEDYVWIVQVIKEATNKVDALILLAGRTNVENMHRVFDLICEMEDNKLRIRALVDIIRYLPIELQNTAWICVVDSFRADNNDSIDYEVAIRAIALAPDDVLPHLTKVVSQMALLNYKQKFRLLMTLVPRLSKVERPHVLLQAIETLRGRQQPEQPSGIPLVPMPSLYPPHLEETENELYAELINAWQRERFSLLTPDLIDLPSRLQELQQESRHEVIDGLVTFMPFLIYIYGHGVGYSACLAIEDISRWWP